jgi:hypothetical protein
MPPGQGMPPGMQMGGGMAPPMRGMPDQANAKTMIAGQSPFAPGGPMAGGMGPGGPMAGGMGPGGPMAGSMGPGGPMAGMGPGGMPGMAQPGPPGGPGGYNPASHAQKTIVAGMAPPIMGGQMMQPGQMPPGLMPGQMPPGQMPPGYPQMPPGGGPASGPNKTVMLQPSEGVISVARTGQAVQPAGTGAIEQGASTLFWIVSLVVGVAVGALAYVVVLQL